MMICQYCLLSLCGLTPTYRRLRRPRRPRGSDVAVQLDLRRAGRLQVACVGRCRRHRRLSRRSSRHRPRHQPVSRRSDYDQNDVLTRNRQRRQDRSRVRVATPCHFICMSNTACSVQITPTVLNSRPPRAVTWTTRISQTRRPTRISCYASYTAVVMSICRVVDSRYMYTKSPK